MGRLIDVDELKHELKWLEEYDPPVYHDVASTIDEIATVDAVEVVRCKDCRFFEDEDEDGDCWCYCHNDITCRDGYCSWGERREDGEID